MELRLLIFLFIVLIYNLKSRVIVGTDFLNCFYRALIYLFGVVYTGDSDFQNFVISLKPNSYRTAVLSSPVFKLKWNIFEIQQ
jgi:hypothetical protein